MQNKDPINVLDYLSSTILDKWCETFGTQQDACEFLFYLLDGLHEECKWKLDQKLDKAISDATEWSQVGKNSKAVETQHTGNLDDSPIQRIFGFTNRSSFTKSGKADSITLEHSNRLELGIDYPNVNSIKEALIQYCTKENLDGAKTYRQIKLVVLIF